MRRHVSEVIVGIGVVAIVMAFSWAIQPRFIHHAAIVATGECERTPLKFFFKDNTLRMPSLRIVGLPGEGCDSIEVLESACCGRTGLKSLGCCVDIEASVTDILINLGSRGG